MEIGRRRAEATWYLHRAGAAPPRPALQGAIEVETAVVGGGLAGLAVALGLAERGREVVLLEADRVGAGASGRNGGLVSAGFTRDPAAIARAVGAEAAGRLHRRSVEAVALLRRRIERHAIACDPVPGVLAVSWFDDGAALRAEARQRNGALGARLEFWPRERVRALYASPRYFDGLFDPDAFHLDPLRLCRGLAAAVEGLGGRIFEGSAARRRAREGGRQLVETATGMVLARHLVLCPGASPGRLLPALDRATLPIHSYIAVTEPLGPRLEAVIRAPYAVYDDRFATGYHRRLPEGRLLWGGRIGASPRPRRLAALLQRDLALVFPTLGPVRFDFLWSGAMAFLRHRMPTIQRPEPGLWLAAGFGGHGLDTTTMAGELVAAAIADGSAAWQGLEAFGLAWAGGPLGPVAAAAFHRAKSLEDRLRLWRQARRGG
jgi:gamma-glutamylputrescine oxidase